MTVVLTGLNAQTTLEVAEDFSGKTTEGETIELFKLLDEGKLVVIDFFSTSCGPCGDYAADIQASYEDFGSNSGNVYFLGVSWGDDNAGVIYYDSVHGITYPSISGFEGGGNQINNLYNIIAYPTVILIDPDRNVLNQHIWEPTRENINEEVLAAGGVILRTEEYTIEEKSFSVFPNPASEQFEIKFSKTPEESFHVAVYDILGNEVHKFFVKKLDIDQKINVSLNQFKQGTYFIVIKTQDKQYSEKLLVTYL